MKIIIINPKKDFSSKQISQFKSIGDVVFIESGKNWQSHAAFKNKDNKVIGLGPKVVDWEFPNEFTEKVPNLKAVCIPTTGFDWIDGKRLRELKIDLTNVPKYSTESVAEYAVSLMFNVIKNLALVIKNGWKLNYDQHQGWEVRGKTMGVVGLGAIGTRIAELGQQIGMDVVYWSRSNRDDRFEYKELNELLKSADFVFPALARNEQTKGMLDKKGLSLMKNGSFIVSITSDDIFDLDYAVELVKSGKLAGIALESEKRTIDDFEGNIWITPPVAWFTAEAFAEDMRIWAETIISSAKGEPQNVVN